VAEEVIKRSSIYRRSIPSVWQSNPEYFTNFLGFARFYVPNHIQGLHNSLVEASFLLPLLLVMVVYLKRKKMIFQNVELATAKLSMVAFYSFIYVPYLYLFYTSSMVSLLIAAFLTRKKSISK
jgi:hypothetical protein